MRIALLVSLLGFLSVAAVAAPKKEFSERRKSEKYHKVSNVLPEGSNLLGARLGAVGAYEGSVSFGLQYENLFSRQFGISGQAFYASYGSEVSYGPVSAKWAATAITVGASATYHPDFVHVPKLDLFAALGLAHSFVSAEAKVESTFGDFGAANMPAITADAGGTFLTGSLNGRYFFDPQYSAYLGLGFGLSTLMVGVDYLF